MSTWQCHGGEKCERLEEEGVSFFIYFLIESYQCVLLIYTQRAREKGNGILTSAAILRAQELSYDTFLSSK